jgi:hypothetical protein
MQVIGLCRRCSARIFKGSTRWAYCSAECFVATRKEKDRERKKCLWLLPVCHARSRRRASNRQAEKLYEQRPERRARRKLLSAARLEAQLSGQSTRAVLANWGCELGRASPQTFVERCKNALAESEPLASDAR